LKVIPVFDGLFNFDFVEVFLCHFVERKNQFSNVKMTLDKRLSLSSYVNELISGAMRNVDKSEQLQSEIHPDILFRYNTINLLVSRRGVGKTFTVLREIIKLSHLKDFGGYTTFLYVSDKTNDDTVNELIKLIKLKVRRVSYSNFLEVVRDLIEAKSAFADAINKGIEDMVAEDSKRDIFTALDITDWRSEVPHTIILLDDAINVLKDSRFKPFRDLLFQNRQPRLTIFICVQDLFGVPVQIRRNCDTVFLFAGMTDKMAFGMATNQLGINLSWEEYNELGYRGVVIINYTQRGTKIKLVNQ
jgi:hypothetical protein